MLASKKPIKSAAETFLLMKSLPTLGCQKIREIGAKQQQLTGETIKAKIMKLQEVPESISTSSFAPIKSTKCLFIYQTVS